MSREGNWARDDAKTLLIVLYTREKRFTDALANARELSARYPRNYLFRLEAADALVAQAEVERRAKNTEAAVKAEREAWDAHVDETLRRLREAAESIRARGEKSAEAGEGAESR